MLETITVAMNAEQDARIRAKLAAHEKAMNALLQVRDEEYATRMRARDEENTVKIAELDKKFEGQIALTRFPARSLCRPQ